MALWSLGVLCFAVVFVPRFFTFMNFGYGYSDLGLYSQFLSFLRAHQFNPMISTFGKTFLELKPEPILYLFFPLTGVSTSPSIFFFLDAICILVAAWACARVAWRKLSDLRFVDAVFFAVLFCPLTLESLHAPTRSTIWAEAPLALLMGEYCLQRRPRVLAFWFSILCLTNLSYGALAVVLVPLLMATKFKRWNRQRRFSSAFPIGLIGALSLVALRLTGNHLQFEADFFWQTLGDSIVAWGVLFWFLPVLAPDFLIVAGFLLCLKIPGSAHDPSLIAPLGALALVNAVDFLSFKEAWMKRTIAAGIAATAVYLNVKSADPFFTPWVPDHHRLSTDSRALHDELAHIPPEASVVASEAIAAHLTSHLNLTVLGAWAVRDMAPDYVITRTDPTPFDHDHRYQVSEINSTLGTRLLRRIK